MPVDAAPDDPAPEDPDPGGRVPAEVARRLAALEARVDALEADARAAASGPGAAEGPGHPGATNTGGAPSTADGPGASEAEASPPAPRPSRPPDHRADPFWAMHGLQEQVGDPGAVMFTGSVTVGLGQAEYQWARPTEHLLASDWAEHAERIGALGHPLRLAILRRLADGEHTVAQLVDELELGSTGVAYHHLSALQSGGWVTSPRRGTWTIPATRLVPLLSILIATEHP